MLLKLRLFLIVALAWLFSPFIGAESVRSAIARNRFPRLGTVGSLRIWKDPLSQNELDNLVSPDRDDLETYPDFLYDTQLYPAAGVSELNFFGTLPAGNDQTLSNMEAQGMLPAKNWFVPFAVCITPLAVGPSNVAASAPGATAQPGILNDWSRLTQGDRAIVTVTIQKKVYGPWRVLACHGIGSPVGFFTEGLIIAAASTGAGQMVANGPADGGFGFQGEIGIPPMSPFKAQIQFANGGSTISRDTYIGLDLLGRRYRAIR